MGPATYVRPSCEPMYVLIAVSSFILPQCPNTDGNRAVCAMMLCLQIFRKNSHWHRTQ